MSTFLLSLSGLARAASAPIPLEHLVTEDGIGEIAISPTGEYLAATAPKGDYTGLVIIRLADMTSTASIAHGSKRHVIDIHWTDDERLLYGLGERYGSLKEPIPTGELLAIDADGGNNELLIGYRAGESMQLGHIKRRVPEKVSATLIDTTPADPGHVLISVAPWSSDEPYTRVERMNTDTGSRQQIARAPVRRARFLTDHASVVRFAIGAGADNVSKLYYRAGDDAEWQLVNDESVSERGMVPFGFSADNKTAYLQVEEASGPDAIHAYDTATGKMTPLLRDDDSDPYRIQFSPLDDTPLAVEYMDGVPRTEYFDAESAAARLHRSLLASFKGQTVALTQTTRDRTKGLFVVRSDRNPGDIYLFDYANKGAKFLLARNDRLDLQALAPMQPIALKARDGVALHGYLTMPAGQQRDAALVVMPHGGPFGVRDDWGYNPDVQMLASRGYAVLQINFRGSSGYGREFMASGYREWGGAMQHDLTDATRWAIEQGIADPQRICIYGASYGGYAALMGVASEPDLYRCAIGHIGVYDLPLMYSQGDIQDRQSGENFLEDTLGRDGLEQRSPARLAERINVPVLLTAGAEDERAPPAHTERMEAALRKAGGQVESRIYPGEGHGLYLEANRLDHAKRVLAFLDRHIGRPANGEAGGK